MIVPARCWRAALSIAAMLPVGCVRTPDSYAVPDQHQVFAGHHSDPEYVIAGARDAAKFFIRDIQTHDAGLWRWTGPQPELEFTLSSTTDRKLVYDFVINDTTFKGTGPVTILFFVNDRLLSRERYDSPGDKRFEKLVPREWLQGREKTRVRARIENTWRTADGVLLGILLKRAGFPE
jgi:hypothetical protein